MICFTNVLKSLGGLQIQVHCDSGSISGIEKFKSQTGIMAVITSKEAIKKKPTNELREQFNTLAKKKAKCEAYIDACPIMWQSSKTERVATSSFAGEIQAIYTAIDLGSVLRTLYGHSKGKINVVVKNDNMGLVHRINSITAMPQERRLNSTLQSIREAILQGDVDDCQWISGLVNLANPLTKSTTGNELYWLLTDSQLVVTTQTAEDNRLIRTHQDKHYILAKNKKTMKAEKKIIREQAVNLINVCLQKGLGYYPSRQ